MHFSLILTFHIYRTLIIPLAVWRPDLANLTDIFFSQKSSTLAMNTNRERCEERFLMAMTQACVKRQKLLLKRGSICSHAAAGDKRFRSVKISVLETNVLRHSLIKQRIHVKRQLLNWWSSLIFCRGRAAVPIHPSIGTSFLRWWAFLRQGNHSLTHLFIDSPNLNNF